MYCSVHSVFYCTLCMYLCIDILSNPIYYMIAADLIIVVVLSYTIAFITLKKSIHMQMLLFHDIQNKKG